MADLQSLLGGQPPGAVAGMHVTVGPAGGDGEAQHRLSASWARAPVIVRLVGFSPSSLEVGAAGAGQPHNDGRPERRIR